MERTFKHLTFLLFAAGAAVNAQPVDSLVNEAVRRNPMLSSYDYRIQAAEYRAGASSTLPAPTLGVEFSQIPTSSSSIVKDAISNNLSISQMFMVGGKLSAMGEMERQKGRVLEQNRGSYVLQLRANVKMAYYRLWLVDRQIEVQQKTLALLEELARTMQPQVLTNRMRGADLLTVQAEVSSEQARLLTMRAKRTTLQNDLSVLLGRDDASDGIVTDSALAVPGAPISETALAERVRRTNPDLLGMDRMKDMNDAEMTVARRELIPDVMLQGMVMRMPNGMLLTSGSRSAPAIQQSAMGMPMQSTDWMYSVMASVTLPFMPWSSERSTGKVDELRAVNAGIDAEKSSMQREMIAKLRSAIVQYTTADSLVRQYSGAILPLMRRAAEAQTTAYETGQASIATVIDARRMELMKQDDSLMAIADRNMALAEIEMMVGEPLN